MRIAAESESIAEENESPSKPLTLLPFVLNFAAARRRFGAGACGIDVWPPGRRTEPEWAVQRARYMTLETIAPISDNPIVGLLAVAT